MKYLGVDTFKNATDNKYNWTEMTSKSKMLALNINILLIVKNVHSEKKIKIILKKIKLVSKSNFGTSKIFPATISNFNLLGISIDTPLSE